MEYPDDANGDVLRRMEASGDDLTCARPIEFTVVFPSEKTSTQFAEQVRTLGFAASAELTKTVENCPWDVVVVRHMAPSHEEIRAFEDSLQRLADAFGGHSDGWGCLSVRPNSS